MLHVDFAKCTNSRCRMCTIMKRQHQSLTYLEQVRQHLSRLPSIDPNTRTLLITGFPNVGKSSFINKVHYLLYLAILCNFSCHATFLIHVSTLIWVSAPKWKFIVFTCMFRLLEQMLMFSHMHSPQSHYLSATWTISTFGGR